MTTTWANRITGHADVPPDQLLANPANFRRHPKPQQDALSGVIGQIGYLDPVIVQAGTDTVIDGHLRVELAMRANQPTIPVTYVDLTDEEANLALATMDPISAMAYHDAAQLDALLREVSTGDAAVMAMLSDLAESAGIIPPMGDDAPALADTLPPEESATLAERFLVPPFSVLDARQGYWQERKRAWLALGIQSEIGRGENALGFSDGVNDRHDTGSGKYAKVSPGESPRDAATLGPDGKTIRGDGHGRGLARSFGQDLMRGEHVVGQNLTWVKGDRDPEDLDDTSRKNLAGGRRGRSDGNHLGFSAVATNRRHGVGFDGSKAYNDHAWMRDRLGDAQAADNQAAGTSVFDPVLCELAYRWFCPPGGAILDPFAGGSVRGIVAGKLGRRYTGIDLSATQIAANMRQALAIVPDAVPSWIVGDGSNVADLAAEAGPFDFLFSCPPYADLEVYSDDPRDLSTMPYDAFLAAYRAIVAASVGLLAPDRFACFVVGDVRDPKGLYRNFVSDTIAAFHDAGMRLYNEAILVTAVGSLPIRVGRQFESGRKLGKTHQNVLVFVKGDAKTATQAIGPIDLDDALFAAEAANVA